MIHKTENMTFMYFIFHVFFYYGASGDGGCDQTLGAFSVNKKKKKLCFHAKTFCKYINTKHFTCYANVFTFRAQFSSSFFFWPYFFQSGDYF